MPNTELNINGNNITLIEESTLSAMKTALKTDAQSAVGKNYNDVTNLELKALLGILLYQAGAIDKATVTIKPLNEWIK